MQAVEGKPALSYVCRLLHAQGVSHALVPEVLRAAKHNSNRSFSAAADTVTSRLWHALADVLVVAAAGPLAEVSDETTRIAASHLKAARRATIAHGASEHALPLRDALPPAVAASLSAHYDHVLSEVDKAELRHPLSMQPRSLLLILGRVLAAGQLLSSLLAASVPVPPSVAHPAVLGLDGVVHDEPPPAAQGQLELGSAPSASGGSSDSVLSANGLMAQLGRVRVAVGAVATLRAQASASAAWLRNEGVAPSLMTGWLAARPDACAAITTMLDDAHRWLLARAEGAAKLEVFWRWMVSVAAVRTTQGGAPSGPMVDNLDQKLPLDAVAAARVDDLVARAPKALARSTFASLRKAMGELLPLFEAIQGAWEESPSSSTGESDYGTEPTFVAPPPCLAERSVAVTAYLRHRHSGAGRGSGASISGPNNSAVPEARHTAAQRQLATTAVEAALLAPLAEAHAASGGSLYTLRQRGAGARGGTLVSDELVRLRKLITDADAQLADAQAHASAALNVQLDRAKSQFKLLRR